jgi:hypothetical protein
MVNSGCLGLRSPLRSLRFNLRDGFPPRLRFAPVRPWSASRSLIGLHSAVSYLIFLPFLLFSFGGVPDSTLGWSAPLPVENEGFS